MFYLTIRDNFMFSAVMTNQDLCKQLLELILETEIERVEVDYEKSIVFNPQYHGVRLDVYAKDISNTRYNVEMQIAPKELEKRARYYHSQIDMELLPKDAKYTELPDTYVIFICNFDPFKDGGKYRYHVKTVFAESPGTDYVDGCHTIFLSTKGKNEDEEPRELVEFLKYVEQDQPDGSYHSEDVFINTLQKAVEKTKQNSYAGGQYMLLEDMLSERESEGEIRGTLNAILLVLQQKGSVSAKLTEQITTRATKDNISLLFSKALDAETVEDFEMQL